MLQPRDYHVLDKDLARLSDAEGAGHAVMRPLRRIGLALGLVLMIGLAGLIAGGDIGVQAPLITSLVVAIYLGLNIGANDVANSAGPAIGARAIGVLPGLALVAAAQLAGALLAGGAVTRTIAYDIVNFGPAGSAGPQSARIMAAALIGAALWVSLANWARAPVSTTHSVIGAVAGAGLAGLGIGAVHWTSIAGMAVSWMVAPLISALIAAALVAFLRRKIRFAPDPNAAAQLWLPMLIGATTAIFAAYLLILPTRPSAGPATLLACAGLGLLAAGLSHWRIGRQIAGASGRVLSLKQLLVRPLIVTMILSGFAHGANDVANIAGPLSVVLTGGAGAGTGFGVLSPQLTIIVLAGTSIAAGSLIFGRRLVRLVGSSITRLNPSRAFCAALAAAATVLACSALGLPVSTTHCAVGGIFGVGFYREWEDRRRRKARKTLPSEEVHRRRLVRRSHVWTTLAAWAVTLPGAAIMAVLGYSLLIIIG
ncbi:MAG: inorganic phosphate transporter [Paracoccus sp. (in: a-proteobacteria)]